MVNIPMAGPWITEHEIQTVEKAMRDWYDKPYHYCETFQDEFAAYHSRAYGLMTPNCTTAIHLLLTGLGIGPGDEVLVPECTWIASAAPITYLSATPVFCDIDPVTWCIDVESARQRITPRTKAMIAVDLYGNMPDMNALQKLCDERGLFLVEDAAEAVGSTLQGVRAGKFGVGSVFSFHRTKTIVTGEGGMLLLDDKALFERCSVLRDHGRRPGGPMYMNEEVTYKYMPFNIQAALGYAQFQRIDELVGKKQWILAKYREHLAGIPDILLNPEPEGGVNGTWITALVFGKSHGLTKQEAMDRLVKLGLPARPFFYPLSSLDAYPGMRHIYEPLNPVSYDVSARGINLPGALNLTEEQIVQVCQGIKTILGR